MQIDLVIFDVNSSSPFFGRNVAALIRYSVAMIAVPATKYIMHSEIFVASAFFRVSYPLFMFVVIFLTIKRLL